jgi:hypothetical protein
MPNPNTVCCYGVHGGERLGFYRRAERADGRTGPGRVLLFAYLFGSELCYLVQGFVVCFFMMYEEVEVRAHKPSKDELRRCLFVDGRKRCKEQTWNRPWLAACSSLAW